MNTDKHPPGFDDTWARARRLLAAGELGAPSAAECVSGIRSGPPNDADRLDIAATLRAASAGRPPPLPGQDGAQDADAIAAGLVARAQRLLENLRHGASGSGARDADLIAFEAVVHVRGRPTLRVEQRLETIVDQRHPGSGFWRAFVNEHEQRMLSAAAATGAVLAGERHGAAASVRGTAWLVAPDLAVTNRHVLFPPLAGMTLAKRRADDPTRARVLTNLVVVLDFAHDDGPARELVYAIDDVPFVSPADDPVDVAVLRVRPLRTAGAPLPTQLEIDASGPTPEYLYVVGHPGPVSDVPEPVQAVFGSPDGRKRVSFGAAMQSSARPERELWHDASTTGGYSGGCVLGFGGTGVSALHCRGTSLAGNRAFTAAALKAHAVGAWLGT